MIITALVLKPSDSWPVLLTLLRLGTLNLTLIDPEAEIALIIDMVIALVFDTVATAREPFLDQALVRCT